MIGIHPQAIFDYPDIPQVIKQCAGYSNSKAFYVTKLVEGISTLAAAFFPKPVIVSMSDFKSNEYHLMHYWPSIFWIILMGSQLDQMI